MVGCHTPEEPRFLPLVLANHGYRTASIGKIHLVPQSLEPEIVEQKLSSDDRSYYGFQEVDLVNGHGSRCFGNHYSAWLREQVPNVEARLAETIPYENGLNCWHWNLPDDVHSSHYIADRAIDFLDSADDSPFFLHVSFPDPHYPFTVPEPYASLYDPADMPPPIPPITESQDMPHLHEQVYIGPSSSSASTYRLTDRVIGTPPHKYASCTLEDWQQVKAIYYGMVSLVDHSIGRILDAVEKLGMVENTEIVFLSDHGDYLGDHGYYGKGLPYESVLRTPLIYSGPGVEKGQTVDSIESTLDIAPTILDMAGVAEPEGMQGVSITSLLSGVREQRPSCALTENDDDFAALRMRTLTTERWRLTYYLNQTWGELIDRVRDPLEMRNLWHDPDYAAAKQDLLAQLLQQVTASIDMANGRRQQPSAKIPKWRGRYNL